jgi:hypothetical protein
MKRRIIQKFKIDEISGVDRPCQQGAIVAIMKRDPTTDTADRRKELPMDFNRTYDDLIQAEVRAGAPLAVAGQRVLQKYGAHANPTRLRKASGATEEFLAEVEAVKMEKRCSRTAALQEARRRHPDLYEAYQTA